MLGTKSFITPRPAVMKTNLTCVALHPTKAQNFSSFTLQKSNTIRSFKPSSVPKSFSTNKSLSIKFNDHFSYKTHGLSSSFVIKNTSIPSRSLLKVQGKASPSFLKQTSAQRSFCTEEKKNNTQESTEENAQENVAADETPKDPRDAKIVELEERVSQLEGLISEKHESLLHAKAEVDNARKRAKNEIDHAKEYGITKFLQSMLPVFDDLGRCIEHADEKDFKGVPRKVADFYEAIKMTDSTLHKILRSHGVEHFNPMGTKFDPNSMDALMQVDDPSKPGGSVTIVIKPGYKFKERLLRAAEVGVNKEQAAQKPAEDE